MSSPKFTETHNLVAFLEKPTESEGFEQIIDFLNANPIKYVLTIQALEDKKKVIITKASVRSDLHLEDAEDMGEDLEISINSPHTPTVTQPSTSSHPQQKQKSKKSKKRITKVPQLSESTHDVANEHVTTTSNDPLNGKDRMKLTELMELYTHLQSRVLALETTKTNQAFEIRSLKRRVKKLEKKERMIEDLNVDEGVALVDETQGRNDQDIFDTSIFDDEEFVTKKEISTSDPVTTTAKVVTTAGVEVSVAAITSQIFMDDITLAKALIDIKTSKPKAKGTVIQEPNCELATRLQEEGRGELTIKEKSSKKAVKGSEKVEECGSKRVAKKLEQEDAKRQRIKEENESAELKRCLEIIPEDDDDDVIIEATPLSSKSPTIVDYKIYKEGRKSFFKIIRVDCNSQNYLTFRKMFKNFNREDLEVLWIIVKERFKKTKPVDDMDNLLFQTL
nr:hypothetical protein [Tanacetum cinerariifolium]